MSKLEIILKLSMNEFDDILTRGRKRYFITFIDNYSDFTFIYLLKNKSDHALDVYKSFMCEVENHHDRKVKILLSNRGTEYNS